MTATKPVRALQVHRAAALLAALSGLALAGCKHGENPTRVAGWALADPAQRHPILVSQQPSTMSLRVAHGASGLAPRQRAEVLEFATHYRASDSGNSRLVISAPSGAANEAASMSAVFEIRELLIANGFQDSSIAVEAYHEDRDRNPAIRISYLRYVAEAPLCGNWPTNLAQEPENVPYPNFGCATQRNFAAQLANPGDLVQPRSETPRASERRDTVWTKYIKGETTISKKSADEKISTKNQD
jgi:pilus assembly protein CpaD